MTKGKGKKSYRVHTRGSFNTFTSWADAAHFLKYLLDNGYEIKGVEKINGNG